MRIGHVADDSDDKRLAYVEQVRETHRVSILGQGRAV